MRRFEFIERQSSPRVRCDIQTTATRWRLGWPLREEYTTNQTYWADLDGRVWRDADGYRPRSVLFEARLTEEYRAFKYRQKYQDYDT